MMGLTNRLTSIIMPNRWQDAYLDTYYRCRESRMFLRATKEHK